MKQQIYPVFDLHCDLLAYLGASEKYTSLDEDALCSLPQLKAGAIQMQVMAFFEGSATNSLQSYQKQKTAFFSLNKDKNVTLLKDFSYPEWVKSVLDATANQPEQILAIPAIENINLVCLNGEKIETSLQRLDEFSEQVGKPFYIIMTWSGENDFGGAFDTKIGLKEKGKYLLNYCIEKNVAIDFSHASDFLIEDTFNFLEKENPAQAILASHSNFRTLTNRPRNLAEEFVLEIVKRNGIIGINAMCDFIGGIKIDNLVRHLEYGLKNYPENIALGLDFFSEKILPPDFKPQLDFDSIFPKGLSHSGETQNIFPALQKKGYQDEQLKALSKDNALRFFQRIYESDKA